MSNNLHHIAIVGAGLIGRLSALWLSRAGYQVTLIDRDTKEGKQSAAYAAAGLLTPLGESLHCEPSIVEMGFESIHLWPSLLDSLDGYTYFQQEGAIMVSHEQDQGDYLRFVCHLKQHFPEHCVHQLNRSQLLELEPELGRSFRGGLYLPQEGQVGNRKLLIALQEALNDSNVIWLEQHNVHSIDACDSGARIIAENQTVLADLVIDCRGYGAATSQTSSKALSDLRAVRGELFQLFAPDVNLSRPIRLMHPRYQLYIAPKTKGFYVVGATEIESDDTSEMTVRSAMELLSAAYSVHPGFAEANIRQHVTQLRPAFSDNQPKISVQSRLIQVNGLYRHGYLISPVVLKQILALVNEMNSADGNFQSGANLPYSHWLPIKELS